MFCSQFDKNLAPILWTSSLYACLILRIQLWATKIDIFLHQIWCPEKVNNFQKYCSQRNKIFVGILMFLVFLILAFSTCKVLVLIKVVPVRNDRYYYSCIYWSRANCPGNTNLNLMRSTYSKSNLAIKSLAVLLLLILSA